MPKLVNFIAKVNENIVNPLIVLLSVTASVYFLFGLAQFVMNSENSEAREEGKQKILWGLVGLTIIASVFAILNILLATFGITAPVSLP